MSRGQIFYLHLSAVLVTVTGAVFAAMKYFMHSSDEMAVVNHPMQPYMLSGHVVVAPLLLFGLGWIFANHIWPKFYFREQRNRITGIASMLLIGPMTLSGYLMQVSTADSTRKAMAIAHWITSAVFVIAYVAHLFFKPRGAEGVQ